MSMKLRITLITLCMDDPEKDVREAAVKTRIIPGPHGYRYKQRRSKGAETIKFGNNIVWLDCPFSLITKIAKALGGPIMDLLK